MADVGILKPGTAIPTEFRGITYRSRLEANVAQFLCDLGLDFEYESRSFLIEGKHYSPDFYLPQMDRYVEARGYLTETSEATLEAFVRQQEDLFVFYSDRAEHLVVALCDRMHAALGTLGYPSYRVPYEDRNPCWLCCSEGIKRTRPTFLDVVMRSSVPTLITDVGRTIQGLQE